MAVTLVVVPGVVVTVVLTEVWRQVQTAPADLQALRLLSRDTRGSTARFLLAICVTVVVEYAVAVSVSVSVSVSVEVTC